MVKLVWLVLWALASIHNGGGDGGGGEVPRLPSVDASGLQDEARLGLCPVAPGTDGPQSLTARHLTGWTSPQSAPPVVLVTTSSTPNPRIACGLGPVKYRVTFYCACRRCTGWATPHKTASGRWPREGRTVAADPRLHPLGSWVIVEGVGRLRVEDTGGAIKGRRLDVFVADHEEARRKGVLVREVQ